MKRDRRAFSPEFKVEAVRLVIEGGRPLSQVARELQIRPDQLRAVAAPVGSPGRGHPSAGGAQRGRGAAAGEAGARGRAPGAGLPKKSGGVLRERVSVKCAVIARHRGDFPLTLMCRVLRVARSAFYAWKRRGPRARHRLDAQLRVELAGFHRWSRRSYGRPRLLRDVRHAGYRVGQERVRRLMREAGLVGLPRRRFRVTTDSGHAHPIAANHLARQFAVAAPNRVWAADITYCWTQEGWLYLAVILDLGSRRVVGWATSRSLERELVLVALQRALALRQPGPALLHHSDRGSQYASTEYQAVLAARGIRCSMSRRGNCWDNAVVESFFATLKRELVWQEHWISRAEAARALATYIEGWYNRARRHSALGYLSPLEYEEKLTRAA